MSTSEGKCVLVEVGALISWCIYSYRIVMLLVSYMWASMTFLACMWASMTFWPRFRRKMCDAGGEMYDSERTCAI